MHPHLQLLEDDAPKTRISASVPIFTHEVVEQLSKIDRPSQYGLLGCNITGGSLESVNPAEKLKSRVFYNVADPTSTFICGSQGSGKSHTLSTFLENCLISSKANQLPHPLTGLVFHYDTFISDTGGMPCEAAYLSSHQGVSVRVLCAPSNLENIKVIIRILHLVILSADLYSKRIYKRLPKATVEELRINQSDLNTRRMLDLMAVSSIQGGGLPLYLHVISRILREMRITQQKSGSKFHYATFKKLVSREDLKEGQMVPLQQRLETLESFMVPAQTSGKASASSKQGIQWNLKVSFLTLTRAILTASN